MASALAVQQPSASDGAVHSDRPAAVLHDRILPAHLRPPSSSCGCTWALPTAWRTPTTTRLPTSRSSATPGSSSRAAMPPAPAARQSQLETAHRNARRQRHTEAAPGRCRAGRYQLSVRWLRRLIGGHRWFRRLRFRRFRLGRRGQCRAHIGPGAGRGRARRRRRADCRTASVRSHLASPPAGCGLIYPPIARRRECCEIRQIWCASGRGCGPGSQRGIARGGSGAAIAAGGGGPTPPWESSISSSLLGSITFYNAQGQVVTGGSITAAAWPLMRLRRLRTPQRPVTTRPRCSRTRRWRARTR